MEVHCTVNTSGDNYNINATVCNDISCLMFEVNITKDDLTHYNQDSPENFCSKMFSYFFETKQMDSSFIPKTITSQWLNDNFPSFE